MASAVCWAAHCTKTSSRPAVTWTEEQRESMRRTSYGYIAHLLVEYREKRACWEAEHAE